MTILPLPNVYWVCCTKWYRFPSLEWSLNTQSKQDLVHFVFLSMASTKSATTKKVMKSARSKKSMKSRDTKDLTEEEKQKLKAIARRKKRSKIARPRDWKRKGHAYRISTARRRRKSGLMRIFLEMSNLLWTFWCQSRCRCPLLEWPDFTIGEVLRKFAWDMKTLPSVLALSQIFIP